MNKKVRRFTAILVSVLMISGTMPFSAMAASPDAFAQKLESMYDEIEMEYRLDHRWWLAEGLNTDETIRKNIQEMYDSGSGAMEFLAMPEPAAEDSVYGWGSQEWTADTQLVITEATKHGMGFSLTSGTHWADANLPDTWSWGGVPYGPDNRAAAKELDYVTFYLEPGTQFNGVIPLPFKPESDVSADGKGTMHIYEEYVLQGVVAAKLVTPRANAGQDFEYLEGTGEGVLDFTTLTDLTSSITENGGVYSLNWKAPADGKYALFAYWMHGTGQTAAPSVSINYTINYIDSYGVDALIDYWEEIVLTDELKELIRQNGRGEMYMDSLELHRELSGGSLWGYNFKNEFLTRRGYDLTPYLPVITTGGRERNADGLFPYDYQVAGAAGQATVEKIRNDVAQTMTEMYLYNVLQPLQTWLYSLNMKLRAEPSYNLPWEISRPAKYVDDVETESLAYQADVDIYRNILGAANMYNRLYSSETGAGGGWNYRLNMDYFTNLFYYQFVGGINRTVTHGYSAIEGADGSTYWPGHEGMYARHSERFNSRQPAFVMYPAWQEMVSRNQKVLRAGQPQRDIAFLRTDYTGHRVQFASNRNHPDYGPFMYDELTFWDDISLQQNGYTYDYFSPQLLEDEENISWTSDVLQPNGPSYKALVLYQHSLELSSAKKILEIAKGGLPVLFVNYAPEGVSRRRSIPVVSTKAASVSKYLNDSDADLKAVVDQIKALPNVAEVNKPSDAMGALQGLGVYPRVGYDKANNKIMTISRKDPANGVFYTFAYNYKFYLNQGDAPYTFDLVLEGEGKPYILNDWTGEVSEAGVYDIRDGRTYVKLTLAVGEAVIVALDLGNTTNPLHAVYTTADDVVLEGGKGYAVADNSGNFRTVLSDGKIVDSAVSPLPAPIALEKWDIVVEDWNEGEKVVNTEEKFGHVTTEVYYTTKKTSLEFADAALAPWKDLPATSAQLATLTTLSGAPATMANVSGLGTYKTSFEVPAGFTAAGGAYLSIGSTGGGSARVLVNGKEAEGLDLRALKLDITDLLAEGTNTIEILVASTLTNRMLERGYADGWTVDTPTVQDYGLQGAVKIVPYAKAPLF